MCSEVQVPDVKGCMVSNAHPELREWCDAHPSPSLFQVPAGWLAGRLCSAWVS